MNSSSSPQPQQQKGISLVIRKEVLEHGVFPSMLQNKLTPAILTSTFTNLNLLSSIDYKIKLQTWIEQAVKHIPGMSESDAQIYYQTYRALLWDVENHGVSMHSNKDFEKGGPGDMLEVPLANFQVDVRCFGLFMALQLYSQQSKMTSDARQNLEKDPWGIKESSGLMTSSVNSSPRSKATRMSYAQSEYQLMVAFVKQNLKLFLRIISSDIHSKEISLSATEFNTLRIIFKIQGPDGKFVENVQIRPQSAQKGQQLSQRQPLSSIVPLFFNQKSSGTSSTPAQASAKVPMNQLIDWINSALGVNEPSDQTFKLNNLNKCITAKSFNEFYFGGMPISQLSTAQLNTVIPLHLTIIGCEDSNIYIDSWVQTLLISNTVNCTIFVAAVIKICTIEKCENTSVTVAASQLRVGNCIDCSIYSYTPATCPVVYGDTRNLRMAPHNATYPNLFENLQRANLKFQMYAQGDPLPDWFQQGINAFRKPILMGKEEKKDEKSGSRQFSVISMVDFNQIVLPWIIQEANCASKGSQSILMQPNLILCPLDYQDALTMRTQAFIKIQQKIKKAGLTPDQEKQLHVAIQGYFREWFVSTGQFKTITDMVKMIDQEF